MAGQLTKSAVKSLKTGPDAVLAGSQAGKAPAAERAPVEQSGDLVLGTSLASEILSDSATGPALPKGLARVIDSRIGEDDVFRAEVAQIVTDLDVGGVFNRPAKKLRKLLQSNAEEVSAEESAFQHGVASGDPATDSVVLWTHAKPADLDDGKSVAIYWEVATDPNFRSIVDRGIGVTGPEDDYTFKAVADGLTPGAEYYYRFKVEGEYSDVGQTRTLPEGEVSGIDFAVFSCVNYPAGYFNAFDAAVDNGFDYSIHLGDAIYEYGADGYASGAAEALGRVSDPLGEIVSLEDYQTRYAQYTSDADYQALRAHAPMIMMWDDHETANDSWETGAENHNDLDPYAPEFGIAWEDRRDAALEAYYRWNPVRDPQPDETGAVDLRDKDASYSFGDLVDLHMPETRLQARDETRADILTALTDRIALYQDPADPQLLLDAAIAGVSEAVLGNVLASGDAAAAQNLFTGIALAGLVAEAKDPAREMIGAEQLADLTAKIGASDATWQMIGSQTLMARMEMPAEVLAGFDAFAGLFIKSALGTLTAEETAFLASYDEVNEVPYNFDAWDGYQAEREAILDALAASGSGAVVIAGDTHNAWMSNLRTDDGVLAAVEFGGPGVTSPGFEAFFDPVLNPATGEPIDFAAEAFLTYVDDLVYANLQDRGYMSVNVTPDAVTTDYVFVSTTQSQDYDTDVVSQSVALSQFDDIA